MEPNYDTELDYEDDLSSGPDDSSSSSDEEGTTCVSDSESEQGDKRIVVVGEDYFSVKNVAPSDAGKMAVLDEYRGSKCPLCNKYYRRLKRHIAAVHLPFFWCGPTACFVCQRNVGSAKTLEKFHKHPESPISEQDKMEAWIKKMRSALATLADFFSMKNNNHLLQEIISLKLFPRRSDGRGYNSPFTPAEQYWMRLYEFIYSEDFDQNVIYTASPPNRVITLSHWRIMTKILPRLPWDQYKEIFEA